MFHLHGRGIRQQGENSWIFHRLYRTLFNSNYAICLARELTSDIEPYLKDPFIIPNGIEKLDHNGSKPGSPHSDVFTIAFLSNFIRSKGILDLIAALAIVKQRGNKFGVTLIGKESDVTMSELIEYIKILHLDGSVRHVGPLYDEQKFDALMKADLFVFPTRYKNEAQPLVIIEAMQCGLPVISTTEGAIPSLIDEGITGTLIAPDDNNFRLADKVEFFIKNPDLSREMGLAGKRKFDSNFTIEIFESNLARVLGQILEKNKNSN